MAVGERGHRATVPPFWRVGKETETMATEKPAGRSSSSSNLGLYLGLALILAVTVGIILFVGFGGSDSNPSGGGATVAAEGPDADATTTTGGLASSNTVPEGSGDCSAVEYPGGTLTDQGELIAPVAETRSKIATHAAACDYPGLQSVMGSGFVWGFAPGQNGTTGAIADWQAREAAGQPVLLKLIEIASLDFADADDGTFVFPAASQWKAPQWAEATDDQIDALVEVYGEASVTRWRGGASFDGYRIGIRSNGSWYYFAGNAL
jgi:hypothetical protein